MCRRLFLKLLLSICSALSESEVDSHSHHSRVVEAEVSFCFPFPLTSFRRSCNSDSALWRRSFWSLVAPAVIWHSSLRLGICRDTMIVCHGLHPQHRLLCVPLPVATLSGRLVQSGETVFLPSVFPRPLLRARRTARIANIYPCGSS